MKSINREHEALLNKEKLRNILDYDINTGIFTNKITRGPRAVKGEIAGGTDVKGYIIIKIDKIPYKAHRLAWLFVYGIWPEDLIDHIDRDKTNNCISNLRNVSNHTNSRNSGLRINNSSGFKGVWKEKNKWAAQLRYLGEHFYLGAYDTPEEASIAYETFVREQGIDENTSKR